MLYHAKTIKNIFENLTTSGTGISHEEAKQRLLRYGKNEIKEEEPISVLNIFISQFKSFIIGILVIAVVISILIHEYLDAAVIGIILLLNAFLGFIQEYRAEKSIEALKKMASLQAVIIRDGKEKKIDAKELVPGDIILLETGEKVPADARLIEIANLQTQEASLTGESLPVKKEIAVLAANTPVADRRNMIFSGTIITNGRGKAVVVHTGMETEFGKIAKMIQKVMVEPPTPLQRKLKIFGEWLGLATIIICLAVFLIGLGAKVPVLEMFIAALSLAVAAIPEGLPAVVTISLALGIKRMVKRHALIRKLPFVETLGSTTVICSDKTGTLTMNEMTVRKIYANDKVISVSGRGYETTGNFYEADKKIDAKEISQLLKTGVFCNDAKLIDNSVIGDPTEGALIVSAAKAGIIKEELDARYPRMAEIGFSSERKRMSTYHDIGGKKTVFCKGAPDVILEFCDRKYTNGKVERLTRADKKRILEVNEQFAKHALRVLGFAYKESKTLDDNNLIFVGLQGMIDPPRPEAKEAIEKCMTAGIKVVMITGDHKSTAEAVGRELGLAGKAVDGKELDKIHDLENYIEGISIYARVDPRHKVMILKALKKKGHVVAMTGDGVNDAPALKNADIGIAMGITGTDVAKEASDMILTDDNFASIVNAVEEGRGIYDNIKKFVKYLLSSNLGEILVVFLALMFGWPLPVIAIHILWINLVTDGLPALALGVDPLEPGIMKRKPRNPKENIINKKRALNMLAIGIIMAIGTLGVFRWYDFNADLVYAQTMAFSVLVMFQLFNVLNCRSEEYSLFRLGLFSNKKLIGAIMISIVLQIIAVHTPLNILFHTVSLGLKDWVVVFLVASSVLILGELFKFIRRRRRK